MRILFWTRWCFARNKITSTRGKNVENTGKAYGEQYTPSAEKRTYYFDNNYAVKTCRLDLYEDGNWYYLNKLRNFYDDSYNPLPIGEG